MDQATFLSILGITISVFFGVYGIIVVLKHRYAGQLTFVREQTVALFDTIVRNLPDLAVTYKGNPASPNLVLIKGALVNTGRKDIAPTMIETPITISVPQGYKWLAANVISTSEDVKVTIEILADGSLQIKNGLLRCKEFIRFQALAEVPLGRANLKFIRKFQSSWRNFQEKKGENVVIPIRKENKQTIDERLNNSLRFYHRIEDTGTIKIIELKENDQVRRRMKRYFPFPVAGFIVTVIFALVFFIKGMPGTFVYEIQKDPKTTIDVKIDSIHENRVNVQSLDGTYEASFTDEEFFAICKKHPYIIKDYSEIKYFVPFFILAYIGVPGLLVFLRYREYKANRKLRILLSLEPPNRNR